LRGADRTVIEGIPVTALPRTLLDLAGMLSAERLERALERSEELGLFDLGAVDELVGRTVGHPGHGGLQRALEVYRDDPAFTRSRLEKRFLALVRKAGLPVPATNYGVGGFELDAYWERERFAVELDVYATHGSRVAFESDRVRQEDLKLLGVEMTRITGVRLEREPEQVMERVAALLERRRAELA
jgi:very-short-patch-repair endonuclease